MYNVLPESAVMPPGSTQRIVVKTTPKKKEQEDGQYEDVLHIYSGLAREGVEASDFVDRIYYEVGKDFPIVYKKVISLIVQCMCSNFNSVLIPSRIRRLPCMIVESSTLYLQSSARAFQHLSSYLRFGGKSYSATHTFFEILGLLERAALFPFFCR
jgi:hypothetical protein